MKNDPELGGSESEKNVMVCRIPLDIQTPNNISWNELKFYVLNKEKMKKIVNGQASNMPDVYISLTAEGYKNLTYNMNQLKSIIEQQRSIIKRQKEYYSKDDNDNNYQKDSSRK
ncbi:hypothetical protein PBI_SCTP2_71 [Salicola phage SCTP-2]|nr:hypothetical protein PBI_SCTP2_71 [Salicola phage SCTP-2]